MGSSQKVLYATELNSQEATNFSTYKKMDADLLAYASHLKRTYVDMTELRAKAINAKKDTVTEPLIFLVNLSPPNLDTHISLCDAATDDADIRRYASTYGWNNVDILS
jgi:hypothetical protein